MSKTKHVLGISGGKDSAALAIYLSQNYPELDVSYYFCDTGQELEETMAFIESLEGVLGNKIDRLIADEAKESGENPFDFYFKAYRKYLPSSQARWCTKMLKLVPFEKYIGHTSTISYVGIRGDEDREGYISRKENIQSIFPFRRNIWSEDVIRRVLSNDDFEEVAELYSTYTSGNKLDRTLRIVLDLIEVEPSNRQRFSKALKGKLDQLLDLDTVMFNHVVFDYIRRRNYPLSKEEDFPLLNNEQVLVREDIYRLLEESGVGMPSYYRKVPFEVNGEKGEYARSRSGCYFCFFQQKIEWIWLYEQHPKLYQKAMEYENEKEMFTWNQHESLESLIEPKRLMQIKRQHLRRKSQVKSKSSSYLLDILESTESNGCPACFI